MINKAVQDAKGNPVEERKENRMNLGQQVMGGTSGNFNRRQAQINQYGAAAQGYLKPLNESQNYPPQQMRRPGQQQQ